MLSKEQALGRLRTARRQVGIARKQVFIVPVDVAVALAGQPAVDEARTRKLDLAINGPVAVECKHGYDACPECDAPDLRMKLKGVRVDGCPVYVEWEGMHVQVEALKDLVKE